ncbi:MAG: hypothetical protein QN141_13495 [Armatimonadota bacterium]|nr:hypothetical protein [Armatimonadota bacterium]
MVFEWYKRIGTLYQLGHIDATLHVTPERRVIVAAFEVPPDAATVAVSLGGCEL